MPQVSKNLPHLIKKVTFDLQSSVTGSEPQPVVYIDRTDKIFIVADVYRRRKAQRGRVLKRLWRK